jgi:hypothetical protein
MHPQTREQLIGWRAEIAAELADLATRLPEARRDVGCAESVWADVKARWTSLRDAVHAAVGSGAISGYLAARLHDNDPTRSEAAAAPGKASRALQDLESRIADAQDGLAQLDKALNGSWPTKLLGREPPSVAKRTPPEPIEIDLIVPAAGAAA